MAEPINQLLSSQPSDSGLQIALHPLVLLTISDYITRHTLRNQQGPIVGALLGQQNGREITIENAFESKLEEKDGAIFLHQAWFDQRLQQMKDVHKEPPLDIVGWYTLMPASGPQPHHLSFHERFLQTYNESALLLGFHPEGATGETKGGKLPLTIYESNYEADDHVAESGEDKEMRDGEAQLKLRFRELAYSIETGEAEMISVDFVARGGGNATAVDGTATKAPGKGKQKEAQDGESNAQILSREDEERIAALTAKINAVKMLQARISLITTYLERLEPSYLTPNASSADQSTQVSYPILRSIQALLNRLPLLIPSNTQAYNEELLAEQNDVDIVSLLAMLTNSVKGVREMGRKSQIVDVEKQEKARGWDGHTDLEGLELSRFGGNSLTTV